MQVLGGFKTVLKPPSIVGSDDDVEELVYVFVCKDKKTFRSENFLEFSELILTAHLKYTLRSSKLQAKIKIF